MSKNEINTSMVGRRVKLADVPRYGEHNQRNHCAGQLATIRSVYVGPDGSPVYDLEVDGSPYMEVALPLASGCFTIEPEVGTLRFQGRTIGFDLSSVILWSRTDLGVLLKLTGNEHRWIPAESGDAEDAAAFLREHFDDPARPSPLKTIFERHMK